MLRMREVMPGPMVFTILPIMAGLSASTMPLVALGMVPVLRSGVRSGQSLWLDVVEREDGEPGSEADEEAE
jgi:hypothetical protein